jgi:hypothetical protein
LSASLRSSSARRPTHEAAATMTSKSRLRELRFARALTRVAYALTVRAAGQAQQAPQHATLFFLELSGTEVSAVTPTPTRCGPPGNNAILNTERRTACAARG